MFVTKSNFEYYLKIQDEEIRRLEANIWEMQGKHARLLAHLGLHEETRPKITELRKKGGPERGE